MAMSRTSPSTHVTMRRRALIATLCCVPVAAFAIARPALVLEYVAGLSFQAWYSESGKEHLWSGTVNP